MRGNFHVWSTELLTESQISLASSVPVRLFGTGQAAHIHEEKNREGVILLKLWKFTTEIGKGYKSALIILYSRLGFSCYRRERQRSQGADHYSPIDAVYSRRSVSGAPLFSSKVLIRRFPFF
ncbi:hypothetical protein QVD17_08373 [Tagetes erecta]|uniref:Uncharacterized protein n=1 Tax=Tagetes erecta TaxID=13708 RepID=A0AAD8L5R7_TARER|nr:hypothetical protein QVD17_08373 [Tagetes erecta]